MTDNKKSYDTLDEGDMLLKKGRRVSTQSTYNRGGNAYGMQEWLAVTVTKRTRAYVWLSDGEKVRPDYLRHKGYYIPGCDSPDGPTDHDEFEVMLSKITVINNSDRSPHASINRKAHLMSFGDIDKSVLMARLLLAMDEVFADAILTKGKSLDADAVNKASTSLICLLLSGKANTSKET